MLQTESKNQKEQKSEKKQQHQHQMQAAINRYDNSQQGRENEGVQEAQICFDTHFSGAGGNPQSRDQTKLLEDKWKDQKRSNTF